MLGANLEKLKQFEKVLKQCLLKRFGAFLPENKISLLNNTEYIIGNEFTDGSDKLTFQGNILRHMLDSIIDITCIKEISLDGYNSGVTSTLVYGRELEDGIIELYTQELAKLFKLNVNQIEELKDNIALANKLKDVYGEALDEKVFIKSASKLLSVDEFIKTIGYKDKAGLSNLDSSDKEWNENSQKILKVETLKELAETCDQLAVQNYLKNNMQVANSDNNKEKESKLFNGITSRSGSIQIIYLDKKKYIKYIDMDGKIHLVLAHNSDKVSEFYRQKIENLKPDEQLDPEQFFHELCEIAEEETMTESDDINFDEINFNQQNVIKFVEASAKLGQQTIENVQDKKTVTHSADGKIHALNGNENGNNDVIYTEDKGQHIEANLVKDGQNYEVNDSTQENIDISNRVLTPEEYADLCMRYANNEELSPEELDALMRSTPDLMESEGPVLSINNKNNQKRMAAFASKTMLIYILMIVAFIGVFIGAMIFSLTN